MKSKFAIISGIMFLLFVGVPVLPSVAATHSEMHPTTTMFDYSVTLFPDNSSWSASVTNIGSAVVWNTVSISNASIQDNRLLLNANGSTYITPGKTLRGSFQCQYFNGTLGSDLPCTISKGAVYQFCTSVGNNTGITGFEEVLGCFSVTADGVTYHGSTHHRLDLDWRTCIRGGKIATWDFRLRNVGTHTVQFYVTLSWQCNSPEIGWTTCMLTSPKTTLASGQVYAFKTVFRPMWNSLPSGTSGLTVSVTATLGHRFQLDENAYNITAA